MSCNGCRVLRKGCSDDCALRPCLQWIKTPEAQGNATVFLAKFYGRAGLVNLLNAAPERLRHEVFRSLLYEACGRIINPVYGAVGLMWMGNWDRCQAAVEAVLAGAPIITVTDPEADVGEADPIMPLKGCDIRHLGKNSNGLNNNNIHRTKTIRNRFKRSGSQAKLGGLAHSQLAHEALKEPIKFSITGWDSLNDDDNDYGQQLKREPSHDSFSVETVEPTLANPAEEGRVMKSVVTRLDVAAEKDADDLVLELTLGHSPVKRF